MLKIVVVDNPLSFPQGTPANIRIVYRPTLYFQKLESSAYIMLLRALVYSSFIHIFCDGLRNTHPFCSRVHNRRFKVIQHRCFWYRMRLPISPSYCTECRRIFILVATKVQIFLLFLDLLIAIIYRPFSLTQCFPVVTH